MSLEHVSLVYVLNGDLGRERTRALAAELRGHCGDADARRGHCFAGRFESP
jgi:hypothetical protein